MATRPGKRSWRFGGTIRRSMIRMEVESDVLNVEHDVEDERAKTTQPLSPSSSPALIDIALQPVFPCYMEF